MKNKKFFLFLILSFFALTAGIIAQVNVGGLKLSETGHTQNDSYVIDARPLLERFNKANGINLERLKAEEKPVLQKAAWNFSVGSTYNWYATNLEDNSFYTVPSTCRAVGSTCYIFVENSIWGISVNEAAVEAVKNALDNSTPANPNKGIYQTVIDNFGEPMNVDNDPKIIVLILDIKDGYTGSGGFVAGYFYGYNQYNQPNSNKAEIYYLDGNPLDLTTQTGLTTGMRTTAHEFQHMVSFNYFNGANDLETFIDEAFSEAAAVICGYNVYSQSLYTTEPNVYLTLWRSDVKDYSRAAKYSLYLYDQFGGGFFKKFHSNRIDGVEGLGLAIFQFDNTRTFSSVLEDWFVANYLNDRKVSTRFGYNYQGVTKVTSRLHTNPNVTSKQDGIYKLGAQYITYKGGKNLNITFDTKGNSNIKIKALKIGSSGSVVEDVPASVQYSVPNYGTTYSEVTFIVYISNNAYFVNSPGTTLIPFSYTSTGTFEVQTIDLAYDTTEPTGILNLPAGDKVAVLFDGVQDSKLKKIKVALRRTGPVNGGIYKYDNTNFLGQTLLGSLRVESNINPVPGVPYPVPWPNWVEVDLSSYNIDTSLPFVVCFNVEGTYPENNRVMVTDYQSSSSYHSFFYDSAGDRWVYYTVSGKPGYIFLNLIRATVIVGDPSDVEDEIELLPVNFELAQNYPNPFNPGTSITYQLAAAGNVELKIFDVLGREIRTLVSKEQQPGKYTVYWNAEDQFGNKVSSGIYFYTLKAGGFAETRKMILLR